LLVTDGQPVAGLHCDDFAVLDDGISRPVVSFSAHDEGRQSQDFLPVDRLEMVIDYGPVTIGGKSYILPLHSVNVGSQRSLMRLENNWYESFWTWGPYMTQINVFDFDDYHTFRGSAHMLPGFHSAENPPR
jgi:hypothetical protein